MKLSLNMKGHAFITDNTNKLDNNTLFLKTAQNAHYFDSLETKPAYITPKELVALWEIDDMRVVGVTGTNDTFHS